MKRSIFAYNDRCRNVLKDKKILSYLLKITIPIYEELPLEEIGKLIENGIVKGEDMHLLFPRENEVVDDMGKSVYDLLFTCKYPNSDKKVDILVNVELQNEYNPRSKDGKPYSLLNRGIYYGCLTVKNEKGRVFTADNYQDLKKVYIIWINTDPPKDKRNSITRYIVSEEHVKGQMYAEDKNKYDLMEIVMINLGGEKCLSVLEPLNELFVRKNSPEEKFRNLKEKFGIEVYEETKGEVMSMCDLGEALVRKSLQVGIKEGQEEIRKETAEFIKRFMENKKISFEEVAILFGLNEDQANVYKELVLD